jgi:hypothetical protein
MIKKINRKIKLLFISFGFTLFSIYIYGTIIPKYSFNSDVSFLLGIIVGFFIVHTVIKLK